MTLSTRITREAVIATAKQLVEEVGPEYVYPGAASGECAYRAQIIPIYEFDYGVDEEVETGEYTEIPPCLVGQIAQRIDPNVYDLLIQSEAGHPTPDNKVLRDFSLEAMFVDTSTWSGASLDHYANSVVIFDGDPEVAKALRDAQGLQDSGKPWSKAIEPILALEVKA